MIWPIAVIATVIIVILLLKKTIQDLLSRITRLKYGETVAEVSQIRQDINEKKLLVQNQADKPNENIEKTLGLFSVPTLARVKSLVENESKINEFSDDATKFQALVKYSQALYLILSFERLYNIIFGSQLSLLSFVNSTDTQSKAELEVFYNNAREKYPDFFDTYSYDDYLDFLLSQELLIVNPDASFAITWLGRDFLKYLVETGKTIHKGF